MEYYEFPSTRTHSMILVVRVITVPYCKFNVELQWGK